MPTEALPRRRREGCFVARAVGLRERRFGSSLSTCVQWGSRIEASACRDSRRCEAAHIAGQCCRWLSRTETRHRSRRLTWTLVGIRSNWFSEWHGRASPTQTLLAQASQPAASTGVGKSATRVRSVLLSSTLLTLCAGRVGSLAANRNVEIDRRATDCAAKSGLVQSSSSSVRNMASLASSSAIRRSFADSESRSTV